MLSWQVGRVKVTRVVESITALPLDLDPPFIPSAKPEALREIPWLYPDFVNEAGHLLLGIQALLVEAPGLRLVVDTCLGAGRDAASEAERASSAFLQELALAGTSRHSVDLVLCTHLHFDHVGWNTFLEDGRWVPTFPNARYLFAESEFQHWSSEPGHGAPEVMRMSVRPIFDADLAQLVSTDHVISPEIRLIPTLGHTPGHVSVLVESQGAAAVITGDMTHHPCQIARPDWFTAYDTDPGAATNTRWNRFREWADKPILVIGTHFAGPTAGHIRRDGETFRLQW